MKLYNLHICIINLNLEFISKGFMLLFQAMSEYECSTCCSICSRHNTAKQNKTIRNAFETMDKKVCDSSRWITILTIVIRFGLVTFTACAWHKSIVTVRETAFQPKKTKLVFSVWKCAHTHTHTRIKFKLNTQSQWQSFVNCRAYKSSHVFLRSKSFG